MIKVEHTALWNRLQPFSIDDPAASVKFSDKLAFHNHWSPAYTARVIEEYKKFVFLCCISPSGASPSKAIDEAWHLHLTYTQNYWKKFCPDVLGMELHHHPSKGGLADNQWHFDWYVQTLHLYNQVFDAYPPEDIWPLPVSGDEPGSQPASPVTEELVTPSYSGYLLLLLVPFLIPFMYGEVSPFHLDGPQFLVFFTGLGLAGAVCMYFIYRRNKELVTNLLVERYDPTASVYQLSRYAFGRNRSFQTAVVDLVDRKILESLKHGLFRFYPANYQYSKDEQNPLIHHLLKRYKDEDTIPYSSLELAYDADLTQHRGLAGSFRMLNQKPALRYGIIILIGVIWAIRSIQALVNERPAGYLLTMMVLFIILFALMNKQIDQKNIFGSILASRYEKDELAPMHSGSSLVNQFAFLGISALTAAYIHTDLGNTFRNNNKYTGSDINTSGACGSSTGCGSSCGGGCGGCGGGD
jgi:hypothetical protein